MFIFPSVNALQEKANDFLNACKMEATSMQWVTLLKNWSNNVLWIIPDEIALLDPVSRHVVHVGPDPSQLTYFPWTVIWLGDMPKYEGDPTTAEASSGHLYVPIRSMVSCIGEKQIHAIGQNAAWKQPINNMIYHCHYTLPACNLLHHFKRNLLDSLQPLAFLF